jgi:hypothetical protein
MGKFCIQELLMWETLYLIHKSNACYSFVMYFSNHTTYWWQIISRVWEQNLQNLSDDDCWEWTNMLLLLAKTKTNTIVFCHCFKMWVLLQPKNLDLLPDFSRTSQCQISWKSCVLVYGCFMYHMGKAIGAEKCFLILNMFLKLLWFNSVLLMNWPT